MPLYSQLWPTYSKEWDKMVVDPNKQSSFKRIAERLVQAKPRYQAVERKTGVPWFMIAVIHERESSQNWNASLAQGDPWNRVSTHVPRGRGPFSSWEAAAIDALRLDQLDRVKDWTIEKILYYLELYNGWGYHSHGVPSAYVWAGSNIYHSGKYISDGVWSSTAVDTQAGTAPIIKMMQGLDPSIKFIRETSSLGTKPTGTPTHVAVGAGAAGTAAATGIAHQHWSSITDFFHSHIGNHMPNEFFISLIVLGGVILASYYVGHIGITKVLADIKNDISVLKGVSTPTVVVNPPVPVTPPTPVVAPPATPVVPHVATP